MLLLCYYVSVISVNRSVVCKFLLSVSGCLVCQVD